ncbi:hypothetical protein ACLQ3C_07455 [Gordonia sp. DT30]|uniref:hypothetical protein n=1 Tax=Gordonia sp. DT30 TaxID=3416546 RepID=UPI003CE8C7D8
MTMNSGTTSAAGEPDDGLNDDVAFDFWHGPHDRWRIEHQGEVVYLRAPGHGPFLRRDGDMRRLGGDFRTVHLGAPLSPLDLMGADSLLPRMSAGMSVVSGPTWTTVGGRGAWSTTLATADGDTGSITVDDATGIIVSMSAPSKPGWMAVTDLRDYDVIGDDRFRWDGPVAGDAAGRGGRRRPKRPGQNRLEILGALVAATDRPHEVIELLVRSNSADAARSALMELLGISAVAAEAVMAMQARRFRVDERARLLDELSEVRAAIETGTDSRGEVD